MVFDPVEIDLSDTADTDVTDSDDTDNDTDTDDFFARPGDADIPNNVECSDSVSTCKVCRNSEPPDSPKILSVISVNYVMTGFIINAAIEN